MLLTPQELLAAMRRARDANELMLELSGLSAGNIPRFIRPEQIGKIRKAAGLAPVTALEAPAERAWRHYLEASDALVRQLSRFSRAIEIALKRSGERLKAAREALQAIQDRATVDAQGRRVYRTADGKRGFTDDGQELSREEVETIHWKPGAPTWEQRQAAGDRLKEAEARHEEILRARDRADYYTQRMAGGEILTGDELDTIRKDLDSMPQTVRVEMEGNHGVDSALLAGT